MPRKLFFCVSRRGGSVWRQVFPKAVITPLEFVGQPLAALALDKAFTFAAFLHDNNTKLGIDLPFSVPVTAGGTNLNFGGKYQLLAHMWLGRCINAHESMFFIKGSILIFPAGYN